ncbi:non-ribosomal peptide synthetase [Rathayibacter toxicus]|uniref:non-ribosomal peptide synthetase n=1 Tax=Rathayibacter toxicus TaxID=145458 RepID=UPI001C03FAA0|nr:amino acid adenylation domain-containing protein [Rathayibacter toxicus]QWL30354.1 non-ribosomal peptide synthetase [Rathayibacter toxicus]
MDHLVQLVSDAAGRFAERVAVETPDRSVTYRQLHAEAVTAAELLRARKARTVAAEGERDDLLIAFVLGAMIAECTLVLLDPAQPATRREQMMISVGADLHVVLAGRVLDLKDRDVASPRSAGDYVFFTSGTTGQPKAISGRWTSVAHFVSWQTATFRIGPGDRSAQLTGVSFDVFLRDILTPLISGATICIPPQSLGGSTSAVLPWLVEARISVIHAVPSLASRWLASPSWDRTASSSLRLTFFAGEQLTGTVVQRWREVHPQSMVVNLYGPTETTLAKFFHVLDERPGPGIQPVGTPLPLTRAQIVDGEIWITTAHGTNGYLTADPSTDTAFVTDDEETLWYRTGDLGRIDDGVLWVLGRADLQVKINGNRIEPEGVAAVLSEHPAIAHAAVVPWRRADDTYYLAAYYTTTDADLSSGQLVEWLSERLPTAHVPSVFSALSELPTTANGKVNRRALPEPGVDRTGQAEVAPRSDREEQVLTEFRAVLNDDRVHMHSDFFAYGGTSLEAVELSVRLQTVTRRAWLMSDVYRLRTPLALAEDVDHRPLADWLAIPRRDTLPTVTGLSPQQRRYRNVYLPRENRSWSNMVALFPLPDEHEADSVEAALRVVVGRHDSLRAEFHTGPENKIFQHYAATVPIDLRVVDVTGEKQDQLTQVERLRLTEANSIIDIAQRPLFRTTLIRYQDGRRSLLWNVHHMVSDGYSQRLLQDELLHLLNGHPVSDLPALAISYRDYIVWAQEFAAEFTESQSAWWREVYARPYQRPLLSQRENIAHGAEGIAYQFPLPSEIVAGITDVSRRIGATPFTVCLTALFDVGYELFGTDDLVIGTPAAGRQRTEFNYLIGNFISLVGIRMASSETQSFAQRVAKVRERTTAAMENQDFQYDQVMEMIGAEPDDDRFPLTTIFLSLVEVTDDLPQFPVYRELGCEVKFDLMGYLKRRGDGLWLEFQTRRELLSRTQLEHWRERFLHVLAHGLHETRGGS